MHVIPIGLSSFFSPYDAHMWVRIGMHMGVGLMTIKERLLEALRKFMPVMEALRRFGRSGICDTMNVRRRMHLCFVSLSVMTALLMFSSTCVVFAGHVKTSMSVSIESEVVLAIADAEQRIIVCYQAVAEADDVGSNTTALLARLNEAGWHLSRARSAQELRDFDSALQYALSCQERLEGFVAEAETLKEAASKQQHWSFMVNVVGSIVATVIVICAGCVIWIVLKKRYENRSKVI